MNSYDPKGGIGTSIGTKMCVQFALFLFRQLKEEQERLWNQRKSVQPGFGAPAEAEFVYDLEGNLVFSQQENIPLQQKRSTLDDAPWKG